MPFTDTEFQSRKDTLNPFQALAGKFDSLGDFQKKALESAALFFALALVYSLYLKNSLCPNVSGGITVDPAFLPVALKFFVITGWPIAVLACLDTTWQGKHSAQVSILAYAATNVFWIHRYGGGFCPYCVIFWLVAYTFSAGFGHGAGVLLRWIPLPGKYIIITVSLFAFIAAQALDYLQAHAPQPPKIVAPPAPTADFSATAQKAAATPHFWQLDPRGGFLNGGKDYCGPVAVSDSLVYLGRHGFPELLSSSHSGSQSAFQNDQAQMDMINELASPHYLGTDPNAGTAASSVLRGIEKYVVSRGYQCSTMEYKGWTRMGPHEREFVLADRPDLDWMRKGILNPNGAVWLIVGWYDQAGNGQWKRTGGHWVTMVGFDAKDPNALLIHNPGTQGNGTQPDDPAQDVIHLTPVRAGTLITDEGKDVQAFGRYRISGPGLGVASGQVAILDAAIVVVVSKL